MASIQTGITLNDQFTGVIYGIINSVNMATATMENMQRTMNGNVDSSAFQSIHDEINQATSAMSQLNSGYSNMSRTVANTTQQIHNNVSGQHAFNQEINEGTSHANKLMNTIKGAVGAYVGLQGIAGAIKISDNLTQTTVRIDLMNDGMQSTEELVNMVYASAQDARGGFVEMANVVGRFGNNAKAAFGSSEEVVAFANLVQKQMTIAGASTSEASDAMLQLSQGLGSGVLRGDELNSIFENAPNLIQNIADYLKVPIGEIREMASNGEITADIVKSAIFSAADEINAKFDEMPMTWGQIWQSMQNTALIAFRPVLQRINDIANSEGFQNFANGAIEALATLANIVLNIFDLIGAVGIFIADNWSMISPVIYGVIAALAVYAIYLGIVKAIEIASATVKGALAVAEFVHCAAVAASTGATIAATAAQMDLNGAMYACPVVWIIILVIALIAILVLLCNWIAQVTGAANSGIGIICGALSVALAFVGNLFVGLINMIIDIFSLLWNVIAMFANFFGNVFNDPVGAIARLFFDLVDCILGLLKTLAGAIDAIFGFNLSDAVQGWRNDLRSWVDDTFGQGTEIMQTLDSKHIDRFEYGEAWDKGTQFGDGIADKISDFNLSDIFGKTDIPNPEDYTSQFDSMGSNIEGISENTGDIKDSLEVTAEDLKYLRDIAERDTINRFTTAEVKVEMGGIINNVSGETDLDGIVDYLAGGVTEAMEKAAEGDHK